MGRKSRPPLCPCASTCTPIWNGLAFDDRIRFGDLNEGYSGDCIGKSVELTYIVGGQEHVNDMNHCIFTPLKGVLRFQICKGDVEAMQFMAQSVLAELDPKACEDCGIRGPFRHFIVTDKLRCCLCHYKSRRSAETDAHG